MAEQRLKVLQSLDTLGAGFQLASHDLDIRGAGNLLGLVERGQTEHVGPVHDQRVGGRDVEAGFDDRGREQHVVLALVERRHHVLELTRRHLAVGDRDGGLRHLGVEEALDLGQILDARGDVERLAAAIAFAPIPRTLQLAMTGVRELSIIATPPMDRLAVRTFVT
jgi:hypothetical protein